ncbi:MAG TPA: hypothetical protein VJ769_02385, partial [Actinomycetes bacterium]|nr:hypothetical protein [Actinomycetes bacterium]
MWSPAGGIPDHPPPFGVWVGDPRPEPLPTPPKAPTKREAPAAVAPGALLTTPGSARPAAPAVWRRSMALLLVAGTLAATMVAGSVVAVVDRLGASTPPRPGPVA